MIMLLTPGRPWSVRRVTYNYRTFFFFSAEGERNVFCTERRLLLHVTECVMWPSFSRIRVLKWSPWSRSVQELEIDLFTNRTHRQIRPSEPGGQRERFVFSSVLVRESRRSCDDPSERRWRSPGTRRDVQAPQHFPESARRSIAWTRRWSHRETVVRVWNARRRNVAEIGRRAFTTATVFARTCEQAKTRRSDGYRRLTLTARRVNLTTPRPTPGPTNATGPPVIALCTTTTVRGGRF